jgi:hypothetical protein
MHGISPKNYSLTSRQREASAEVAKVLPELPTTLCDLISQLAMPDFSLACQTLELNEDGELIKNQRNLAISAMIELALTASSSDCGPLIKAQIFINATEFIGIYIQDDEQYGGLLRNYLALIMNELKERGEYINLDDVVLSDLDLSSTAVRVDLCGMSAKRATFNKINMKYLKLIEADLSGAQFIDTSLEQADISNAIVTGATFTNVSFKNTVVCELTGNQSTIYEAIATSSEFTILHGVMIVQAERTYLNGGHVTAAPDSDHFTLPAKKIIVPVQKNP